MWGIRHAEDRRQWLVWEWAGFDRPILTMSDEINGVLLTFRGEGEALAFIRQANLSLLFYPCEVVEAECAEVPA